MKNTNLVWVGRDGALKPDHPYLFFAKTAEPKSHTKDINDEIVALPGDPFGTIMRNLHELNDFCVTLYEGLNQKISESLAIDEEIKFTCSEEEVEEVYYKFAFGYDAEKIGRIYCPASSLVMLYATYIQSLILIATHFGEEDVVKDWKLKIKANSSHEYEKLVMLLRDISKNSLSVFDDSQVKILIGAQKNLRNKFMHGDWREVEKILKSLDVRSCFKVVSRVMTQLEEVFDENLEPWVSKKIIL